MKKIVYTQCLSILLLMSSTLVYASETTHWGYEDQIGPTYWGKLNPSFEQCQAGKNQTPINITNVYRTSNQHPLDIEYKVSPQDIVFNGHTVQINTKENDQRNYVKIDGEKYILQQFHFHTPSENTIEGKSFPLEVHFVNANAQGELAVVAVMFNLGKANLEWDKFWKDLSPTPEQKVTLQQNIDLEKLIPKQQNYYRFSGSLTTPPCSEGVIWMVMRKPMTISKQQLDQFKLLLKEQPNNRPIQPSNGRIVIAD